MRAPGHGHGAGRPRAARRGVRRGRRRAGAEQSNSCCTTADNVEATGFVEHLKLPHYVDFQSELETIRQMRRETRTTPLARGRRMSAGYNFAYLDEQTKRMIRRALLKARRHPRPPGPVRQPRDAAALWLGHRRHPGHRQRPRPGRRAESDRPGRRRHHQRRQHPPLLRPHRRRRAPPRAPPRRPSSRPATASRKRRSARARSSSTRCRCRSRCPARAAAAPRPRRMHALGRIRRSCTSSSTRTSPATATSPPATTTRSW